MVMSGMMVIMHRTGGICKRLDTDTVRKIRDLAKNCTGSEIVVERSGGSFTFEIDVQSEGEAWQTPKKAAKAGTRSMDVDDAEIIPS